MATLIPALGTCVSRMTSGERRLAERLEQKLDDDYLLWYDVPIGSKQVHPDFVVLHPRRGLLVLETKDWKLDTIHKATRQYCEILVGDRPKPVMNPLSQARHYAIDIVNELERDPPLCQPDGPHAGKLAFPWGYGVVLTRITRKQFEASELDQVIEPHRVICQDEMLEHVDPEAFQQRLWDMFPYAFGAVLALPQIDRIRWLMFPEVRTPVQGQLFDAGAADLPDVMRVMDLQQEQLARSLGDGHRVIHGVAGSGKTMILGYRAEFLARHAGPGSKPILVLCFNKPLATQLDAVFTAKELAGVQARNFHAWCRQQLKTYGQAIPDGEGMFEAMVDGVIRAVERGQIPAGQYRAILIDEGHDFKPHWLKLVTQMVDPDTNALLVLYDDAQSIFERRQRQQFSFKSVGIQAQGRTTILKINYRNTRQILALAQTIAADLLTPEERDDDGVPLLQPLSCGREGPAPVIVRLPNPGAAADRLAELLDGCHRDGHAWGDMAILCRDYGEIDRCAAALRRRRLPYTECKKTAEYQPGADTIHIMTMKVSKGLEFPVVGLAGAGRMPLPDQDIAEEARLFYVAATRASQHLLIPLHGDGEFGRRLLPTP